MLRHASGTAVRVLTQRPVATAFFLLAWPVLLVAALLPDAALFTAGLVACYLSDRRLGLSGGLLDQALRSVRFPATVRFALRQLLLVLLLVRMDVSSVLTAAAVTAFAVYYVLQVPQSVFLHLVQRSRRLPLSCRNVDLTGLRLRDTPPHALTSGSFTKSMHTDVLALAGLLTAAVTGTTWPGILGCALMTALVLAYALLLGGLFGRARGMPGEEQVLGHVDTWLGTYRPTVMLYFSGTRGSAYQVNMWLEAVADAGGRPLVLLRERHILDHLDPTPLPVLCIPSATDVMGRDFSTVRLVLYPANVGPNIHVLRMPQARHVFVGHGDSDKVASINPYAKVYDQVWTAGRAGRDRWAAADVGVRDSAVVEVGRPQLAGVHTGPREPGGSPFTVLYAPTWEGWTDEPGNTSLVTSGAALVELLLSLPDPVRVLYKPHPYTGIRSPEARAAHDRIVAALERANTTAAPAADGTGSTTTAAREELARVEEELASLGSVQRPGADDAERSRDHRFTEADAVRREELRHARDTLFWRSREPWSHQHITASGPHLYSCFNACDLLVSDVSSVVSDFMASQKPYAITDVEGLGEEEFRRRNPSARGAYLLSADVHELAEVTGRVRAPGPDPLAAERQRLRQYLLGPESPDATTRFHAAVHALLPADDEPRDATAEDGDGVPARGGDGVPAEGGEDDAAPLPSSPSDGPSDRASDGGPPAPDETPASVPTSPRLPLRGAP